MIDVHQDYNRARVFVSTASQWRSLFVDAAVVVVMLLCDGVVFAKDMVLKIHLRPYEFVTRLLLLLLLLMHCSIYLSLKVAGLSRTHS